MDRNRFSLLLLEPGEYYFEDYSVYWSRDSATLTQKDVDNDLIGRLRICSKSLILETRVLSDPIVKLPFKECTQIKRFVETSSSNEDIYIECNMYVEMLSGNVLAPYVFKHGTVKFYIRFNYGKVEDYLSHISQLHRASSLPVAEQNQMIAAIASSRQRRTNFDRMWLGFNEIIVGEPILGSRITPLVINPGNIVLTNVNLFFQPFNNIESNQYIKIKLSDIKDIIKRRFLLQHVGLEIYCKENDSESHLYVCLKSKDSRDELFNAIKKQPELRLEDSNQEIMTLQWQNGTLSNYDYLLYVNSMADRTFNDLTQYPVFPWVLSDYVSEKLDLTNLNSFRDLTKPIGALNPVRLKHLKERYNEMPVPKFLYGSHYSAPGFVLFYLVRKFPHYMLCLQNGRFDHPDRMFNSVSDVWKNVLANNADFKELIPEFYDTNSKGDFLGNMYGVNFGCRHNGARIGDVALPPWAKDPEDFVSKLRDALECDYVSSRLHHWIDLIFGYKQRDEEAEKADNEFYHLCYEGAVDLDKIEDWNERHAIEVQIMEFGQIPKQVFKKPHPVRTCAVMKVGGSGSQDPDVELGDPKNNEFEYYWKWNNISHEPSVTLTHRDLVTDLKLSEDSKNVFSVSRDKFLKMYNLVEGKQVRNVSPSETPLYCVELLEDGNTAVIGSYCIIFVYNIKFSSVIEKLEVHDDVVTCIHWCPRTTRLITGAEDGYIRVWRGQAPWTSIRLYSQGLVAELQHNGKVPGFTVSMDEKVMASGSESGKIFVWSLDTYKVMWTLKGHEDEVTGLALNAGAERLISCGRDRSFRVFDLTTGSEVYCRVLDQELDCVIWDGCRVLLGGRLGTLFVWDLLKNALVTQMETHPDGVSVITCNKDGSKIVTGGRDGKIFVWPTIS